MVKYVAVYLNMKCLRKVWQTAPTATRAAVSCATRTFYEIVVIYGALVTWCPIVDFPALESLMRYIVA